MLLMVLLQTAAMADANEKIVGAINLVASEERGIGWPVLMVDIQIIYLCFTTSK
jgi:hypothetical protein